MRPDVFPRILLALIATLAAPTRADAELADPASGSDTPPPVVVTADSLIAIARNAEADSLLRVELDRLGPDPAHDRVRLLLLDRRVEALLRDRRADDAETLALAEAALTLRARLPDRTEPGRSRHNLGWLLRNRGEPDAARVQLEAALDIRRRAFGDVHLDVAATRNALGILHRSVGDLERAADAYEEVVAIRSALLGPDHEETAKARANLAVTWNLTGRHLDALAEFERAETILAAAYGPDHMFLSTVVNGQALCLFELGQLDRSLAASERVVAIREATLGPDHPGVAEALVNLGVGERTSGNHGAAIARFERALEILEARLRPTHPHRRIALTNLGDARFFSGDHAAARRAYDEALSIGEAELGPDHPELSYTLGALARLNLAEGRIDDALARSAEGVDIRLASYGAGHPLTALARQGHAELLRRAGRLDEALALTTEVNRGAVHHLRTMLRGLPGDAPFDYLAHVAPDPGLSVAIATEDPTPAHVRAAWDLVIRGRARALDEAVARHRSLLDARRAPADDAPVRGLLDEHDRLNRRLARALLDPGSSTRDEIHGLEDERDRLARRLLEVGVDVPAGVGDRAGAGLAEVTTAVGPHEALVAYVRYRPEHCVEEVPARYAAFVLSAPDALPLILDLGDAASLDAAVGRWREEAAFGTQLAGRPRAETDRAMAAAGHALRRAAWDPVAAVLGDPARVHVVTDGTLTLVNLLALPRPGSDDHYLVEDDLLLRFLTAERDLLDPGDATGTGLLAVGAPLVAQAPDGTPDPVSAGDLVAAAFRGSRPCGDAPGVALSPLPHARDEIHAIVEVWRNAGEGTPVTLVGRDATEAAVKAGLPGPRVLHLATHGFFLGAGCGSGSASRGVGGLRPATDGTAEVGNPLLAGLFLAGADPASGALVEGEDGILTAEEIGALDARGVEWAVLSACDTGLGPVREWEGALGLRRAFRVAGARTVIMSLWAVEDLAARAFMEELYQARFEERRDTADALRAASRRRLEERRREGASTHPVHWAAFLASEG